MSLAEYKEKAGLSDYISKRKSTRKFNLVPLKKETLTDIENFANNLTRLYDDIKVEYKIVGENEVKNLVPIKAPHYFIISSERKDGYLLNVGFMFQQMDLYLSKLGIGSCWLGMAKPMEKIKYNSDLEFVIILAFGLAVESPYRELAGFKRKEIQEVSNKSGQVAEAVRLAPSASNGQPWYLYFDKSKIQVFCIKHMLLKAVLYEKMNKVDIGIALAHIYVANNGEFKFYIENKHENIKGYFYIGSVDI